MSSNVLAGLFASLFLLPLCCGYAAESEAVEGSDVVAEPTVEDFFQIADIHDAEISPQGTYVAYVHHRSVMAGNARVGYHPIFTLNRNDDVRNIFWSGDSTVLVQYVSGGVGAHWIYAIRIAEGEDSFGAVDSSGSELRGYVYDPLPDEPNYIILGKPREKDDSVATDLFRVNLFGQVFPQTKGRHRLNRGANNLFSYLRDVDGELALGISFLTSSAELWVKAKNKRKWSLLWTAPEDADFEPIALSPDGTTLWAISNATTDKLAAVSFDMATGQISATVFEDERYDISSILLSPDKSRPIGVTILDGGLYRYHYFDEENRATLDSLQALFENQSIYVMGRSRDRSKQLVHASSSGNPGSIHFCDLGVASCSLVAKTKPWLDSIELATTVALSIESTDKLIVESFLTLPADVIGLVPLIVMPHGGPIGISDDKYYSGDVQWLARNGYAILQVNYRGSGGYGRKFETAGLREWGRGIEDDIEAAVHYALASFPQLDAENVGILGASYGGYSALISVIENPELYKCAASFAGVSDLTLLFNRSDIRVNNRMRDRLGEMVGDYHEDYESLVAYSPVYQYQRFSRPLFIAHGDNDAVVDVEHSWRLRKMLRLIDVEPEFHIFENLGHGFDYVSEAKAFYDPLIAFLDKHLKPEERAPAPH